MGGPMFAVAVLTIARWVAYVTLGAIASSPSYDEVEQ